jgi:hypothetical protein
VSDATMELGVKYIKVLINSGAMKLGVVMRRQGLKTLRRPPFRLWTFPALAPLAVTQKLFMPPSFIHHQDTVHCQ